MIQRNASVEPNADARLYESGARLVFLGHDVDEGFVPSAFLPGDLLVVLDANGCGMGIDCKRLGDGVVDMAWPTEVGLSDGDVRA